MHEPGGDEDAVAVRVHFDDRLRSAADERPVTVITSRRCDDAGERERRVLPPPLRPGLPVQLVGDGLGQDHLDSVSRVGDLGQSSFDKIDTVDEAGIRYESDPVAGHRSDAFGIFVDCGRRIDRDHQARLAQEAAQRLWLLLPVFFQCRHGSTPYAGFTIGPGGEGGEPRCRR